MCYYLKIHPCFSQRGTLSHTHRCFPRLNHTLMFSLLCWAFVAGGQPTFILFLTGYQDFRSISSHYFHALKLSSHLLVEEVSCCCKVMVLFCCGGAASAFRPRGGVKSPRAQSETRLALIRQSPGVDLTKKEKKSVVELHVAAQAIHSWGKNNSPIRGQSSR